MLYIKCSVTLIIVLIKNRCFAIIKKYYDNKDIREMLKVNDKLIRKYRELGMLGYSQYGGKYWYSSEDIKCFLEKCRCRS